MGFAVQNARMMKDKPVNIFLHGTLLAFLAIGRRNQAPALHGLQPRR